MKVRPGGIAARADPADDLAGRDLLALLDERSLHHVAVPGHDVAGGLDLHHPAAAALAGIAVDVTRLPAPVVFIALYFRDDPASRRRDRRVARNDQVDTLVGRSFGSTEAGADHRAFGRDRPAR